MPGLDDKIILFPRAAAAVDRLSTQDKIDLSLWDEVARTFGYDRIVIHERLPDDPPEMSDFVSIYRAGQPWACWGLARRAGRVAVWRCGTGRDVGEYACVGDALRAILPPTPTANTVEPPLPPSATVIAFGRPVLKIPA